ncbi:hypothetical protein ACFL0M_08845, partial [Thermodesulfobacteriota bacterium]
VLILIIFFHSFRSFGRVAGPLYRFHVVFEQVRCGDLSYPIKIRTKDYLHREEKTLNAMLQTLADKIADIKQAGEDALKSFDELEKKMTGVPNWNETHKGLLDVPRRHLKGLLETARYFRPQRMDQEVATGQNDDRRPSD